MDKIDLQNVEDAERTLDLFFDQFSELGEMKQATIEAFLNLLNKSKNEKRKNVSLSGKKR
jgi:hypothetical protein